MKGLCKRRKTLDYIETVVAFMIYGLIIALMLGAILERSVR